jgi:hypothetical protein
MDPEMRKWAPYIAQITNHYKRLRKYDVIYELYVCYFRCLFIVSLLIIIFILPLLPSHPEVAVKEFGPAGDLSLSQFLVASNSLSQLRFLDQARENFEYRT